MFKRFKILKSIILTILFFLIFSCSTSIFEQNDLQQKEKNTYEYIKSDLKLDPIEKKAMVGYFYSKYNESLPKFIDYSSYMPPVGNQGVQGSCTAWAVAYAAKSFQEGIEEKWDLSDPAHQFSPAFIYNQLKDGIVYFTLQMLVEKGCDTLLHFPYNQYHNDKLPDINSFKRALKYKAKSWNYLKKDTIEFKKILASGNVIIAVIPIYNDLYLLSKDNPIYDNFSGKRYGHHAICIVGYDDDKNAFKFINSWGENWGINGYGYLTYDVIYETSPYFSEAYIIFDDQNIEREKKVIHYYSTNNIRYFHYKQDNNLWTDLPGKEMTYEKDNWYIYVLEDKDELEFCFNSGYYSPLIWDSKYGVNYKTNLKEIWIKDWTIYDYNPLSCDIKVIIKNSNNNQPIKDILLSIKNKATGTTVYLKSDENGVILFENIPKGEYNISGNIYNYLYENFSQISFDIIVNDKTVIKEIYLTPACNTTIYLSHTDPHQYNTCYEFVGLDGELYKNEKFYKEYTSLNYYGNGYFNLGYLTKGDYTLIISERKNNKVYKGKIKFTIQEDKDSYSNTMTVYSFYANFLNVYLRGTFNNWDNAEMQLIDNNLWELEVDFDNEYENKFKFDIYKDWNLNYGDNNIDGICEQNGSDIHIDKGKFFIRFNDNTKRYYIIKTNPNS